MSGFSNNGMGDLSTLSVSDMWAYFLCGVEDPSTVTMSSTCADFWAKMAVVPPPISPPPAPSGNALTQAPASADAANALIDEIVSQGVQQSQQAQQAFSNSQASASAVNLFDPSTWTVWIWLAVIAAGFVGFKFLQGRL